MQMSSTTVAYKYTITRSKGHTNQTCVFQGFDSFQRFPVIMTWPYDDVGTHILTTITMIQQTFVLHRNCLSNRRRKCEN